MGQHIEVEEKLNKQASEKTSLRAVVRIKVQKRMESFAGHRCQNEYAPCICSWRSKFLGEGTYWLSLGHVPTPSAMKGW